MSTGPATPAENHSNRAAALAGIAVVALLFAFLVGIRGLGDGFKLLGGDLLEAFFSATSNPFIALMVGILTTTLVQSSSVTTSMVVGLVAAPENPLPLANAVPMIMGANIGTTATNTIVSIAHMGRPDEFRRAFAVATCHDAFNFLAVLVLLPLEIVTGFLSKSAATLADRLPSMGGGDFDSPIAVVLKAAIAPLQSLAETLFAAPQAQGVLLVACSGALIFASLMLIVRTLHATLLSRAERMIEVALGNSGVLAILIGCIVTAMVQSSSITTSLLVPMAGVGPDHAAPSVPGNDRGEPRDDDDGPDGIAGRVGTECTGRDRDRADALGLQSRRYPADLSVAAGARIHPERRHSLRRSGDALEVARDSVFAGAVLRLARSGRVLVRIGRPSAPARFAPRP